MNAATNSSLASNWVSTVAGAGSLPVPNQVLDRVHLHEAAVVATGGKVSCRYLRFLSRAGS